MKKLICILFIFCFTVVGAVNKTIENGGKVTITTSSTEEVITFSAESVHGCNIATVEVVSCNAAGVAITMGTASPADWTTIARQAAGSKTHFTFCFATGGTGQAAVPIRIYGTAGDVVTLRY